MKLVIDKPIRLIELFAGIGSQAKALKLLNANFEHYRICEFDKYAIKSYNAIHGTNFETSDITKITAGDLGIVDTDKYCYIMTYSFPCQDLSLAGKQKGMAKGENTRSGLLWEVERLLNECTELPQILLMENVTQVHGKKNIEHFNEWIAFLESKGYRNYWKDLNAKNFCIPQNRNRTFMVSILGDYTYEFPQEFPLELRLKDMLEKEVDEKYYLSDKGINSVINGDISKTVRAGGRGSVDRHSWDLVAEPKVIGGIGEKKSNGGRQWYLQDRIYDNNIATSVTTAFNPFYKVEEPLAYDEQNGYIRKDGTVGTLTTDGSSPKHNNRVIEPVRLGYIPYPNSDKPHQSNTFYDENAISPTLDTCTGGNRQVKVLKDDLRIRKLTPKECWRLMGFTDEDFEKAAQLNSNAQLYKQAGNSIVVSVLYYIFKGML
jgi:DNA (cytosine-5)-methyltransferase 1